MSNFCHDENCINWGGLEKCSCGELFCEDHINNHEYCNRIKKRRKSLI